MRKAKYAVTKKFTIPVGHRLSKHEGLCKNYHGHNFDIVVGISSSELNDNNMVIDFKDLKSIVNEILDEWDHTLLVNKNDPIFKNDEFKNTFRMIAFDFDPTAEKMAEVLYTSLSSRFQELKLWKEWKAYHTPLIVDFVQVYENDGSSAIFSIE